MPKSRKPEPIRSQSVSTQRSFFDSPRTLAHGMDSFNDGTAFLGGQLRNEHGPWRTRRFHLSERGKKL
jgi:hypothetical protein